MYICGFEKGLLKVDIVAEIESLRKGEKDCFPKIYVFLLLMGSII